MKNVILDGTESLKIKNCVMNKNRRIHTFSRKRIKNIISKTKMEKWSSN